MKTVIILALLVGGIFGYSIDQAATTNAKEIVYSVCNNARMEISGASEQKCGDLQDKYGIEFLCDSNNQLASNHCWTEAK